MHAHPEEYSLFLIPNHLTLHLTRSAPSIDFRELNISKDNVDRLKRERHLKMLIRVSERRSFHVVERKRAMKCTKIKKKKHAHVQRVQNYIQFVNVKYAHLCCLLSCFRSLQFRENVVSLNINTNKQAFPRTYGKALLSSKAASAHQRCYCSFILI